MCLAKKDEGLGFQDLKCFNLALLAKQCWRLLHNHDSLLYKIYKAKYFPNNSFLEATVPSHSSYAWRSITHGRELIKQESCWRVGNGSLINIWTDRWLPSDTNQRILSPRTILPLEARVADLMEFSSFQPRWKTMLIDTIFYPFETLIIKAIPLSPRRPEDSLVWTRNRSGKFMSEVPIFYNLRLTKSLLVMKLHHLTQPGFTHFGMAFGLLKFLLRLKHSFGKHVMIVYQLVRNCLKGRYCILSLVCSIMRKLKLVTIFSWSVHLLKPFGSNFLY